MTDYILSIDPGTKNMAYCLICVKTLKIVKWEVFSIEHKTYEGRAINLAKELDRLRPIDIPDWQLERAPRVTIVIEQQMGINTKTNRVCGFLIMYFALEKLKGDLTTEIQKIVHYPARHKINYYTWKEGDDQFFKTPVGKKDHHFITERIFKLKKGHYRTKKILIEHCRRLLIQHGESDHWKNYFIANKAKVDDLSDAAMQAFSYIRMYNL